MADIELLSQTDSQALKWAEIEGLAKKWVQGKYSVHLAMFLDTLTLMLKYQVLSLTAQQEVHDPVNTIKRINEFSWTMTKLKIFISNSVDESRKQLTNFMRFLKEVTLTENGSINTRMLLFKKNQASLNSLLSNYKEFISIMSKVSKVWFSELQNCPLFGQWWSSFCCKVAGLKDKVMAIEIILANYSIFMADIESLSQTDSQALKWAEIKGLAKKWVQGKYYMHLAMFLDILRSIEVLGLTRQQEVNDPVNTIKRINEFSWTITKLKLLISNSVDESRKQLTNFMKFLNQVTFTEDGSINTRMLLFKKNQASLNSLLSNYKEFISIMSKVSKVWFSELQNCPLFGQWWSSFCCKVAGLKDKVMAIEIILANYSIFMADIESLSQTDSQALKWAEIKGLAKKWVQGKYYMHLAMFCYVTARGTWSP